MFSNKQGEVGNEQNILLHMELAQRIREQGNHDSPKKEIQNGESWGSMEFKFS